MFSSDIPSKSPLPHSIGYRMPAEWEHHEATWLAWPHRDENWPGHMSEIENLWIEMIRTLQEGERVHLLVNDEREEEKVRGRLTDRQVPAKNLFFFHVETRDVWIRDYGPIFVVKERGGKRELAFNSWKFNAWGGKYPELLSDSQIPRKLEPVLSIPAFYVDMVLEGGAVDVNGEGTCLVTEQCLLNPNRNPGLGRSQIEQHLKEYLGVTHILWLGKGIVGDHTDGHVDNVARFVHPTTVVCAIEENPADENYAPLQENFLRLKSMTGRKERPLEVVCLPMPNGCGDHGERFAASYTNFYIANRAVLVPIYNHENDERALRILRRVFPDRQVIGIDCRHLVRGGGAIHCVTQQQPAKE